ncbi:hypothetical protein AAC387_Pa04g1036 [Persea americana]
MPRGRPKRRRFSNPRPLAFSPFARSIALLQSKRHNICSSEPHHRRKTSQSHGNGASNIKIGRVVEEEHDKAVVQADFAFFDPKPDDFHGVKILLQSYLDNEQWDLSGFVGLILGQTTVGTVVKIEGEEDDGLFSVISALNLGRYKNHQCIMQLKEFLLKVCQDKDVLDDLKLILGENAPGVGLLVSQRVVNLPPKLLIPLHDALFDEVSWATEDEPTEELRDSFRFKFYLLITKFYKNKHPDQRKGSWKGDCSEPVIYIKPEDEIFHKLSLWSFSFPLRTQHAATHELRSYRLMGLVMVVEEDKVSQFREELKSIVTD